MTMERGRSREEQQSPISGKFLLPLIKKQGAAFFQGCSLFFLPVLGLIIFTPSPHGIQNGIQTFSKLGQTVLDSWRNFRIYFAANQPFFFHIPQLGGENFLRNAADGLFEFSEPLCPWHEITQDQDFPFIPDQHKRCFYRTGR